MTGAAAGPSAPFPLPDLPRFVEVAAADDWATIDFISDLHLSEATPRALDALAHYLLTTPAESVWILGDLFEVWVGDDARNGPFEKRCIEVLAEAACHRSLHFMHGNRDFLVGNQLLRQCGITALADPTVLIAFGQRLLITHGDALCLGDTEYQAFRAQVRSDAWQRSFLERTLAARRQIGREMREKSRARHRQRRPGELADVDPAAAVQWLHLAGARTLLHGHTHRPGHEVLAPGFERLVLSDWSLERDGGTRRAEALRWTAEGFERVTIDDAPQPRRSAETSPA